MVSSSGGRLSVLSFLQCLLGRSKKARQKGEEEQTDKKTEIASNIQLNQVNPY